MKAMLLLMMMLEYIEQQTGPFEVTIMWLDQYFKRSKPFITPPIQLEGTEFP